jgi:hypothetical protein
MADFIRVTSKLSLAFCLAATLASASARGQFSVQAEPSKTPARELLPEPPQSAAGKAGLPDQLSEVGEVCLERAMDKSKQGGEVREHFAATIRNINFLNNKKKDGFVRDLMSERADLAGLPFVMGEACRMDNHRRFFFGRATQVDRMARSGGDLSAQGIRRIYQTTGYGETPSTTVSVLMQVLTPEKASVQEGLVDYLAGKPNADAARALANLAIFSDEAGVRQAAVKALGKRPSEDKNDIAEILAQGLEYPWPAVTQRAGDAIASLKLKELIPRLIDELERPDPRAPRQFKIEGKPVTAVRELVRVNHHRNCLLCHAPADDFADLGPDEERLTAQVLLPNLPFSGEYYKSRTSDITVRFDVTYLRQDFSMMMPVKDAHPWPAMQRFDFLVRTRALSKQQANDIESLLQAANPDGRFPNRRAALKALRELTGLDAEPTAEAWRRVLAKS